MEYLSFQENFVRIFEKNELEAFITEDHICKFFELTERMVETNKVMIQRRVRGSGRSAEPGSGGCCRHGGRTGIY